MKKLASLLPVLALLFSLAALAGCASDGKTDDTGNGGTAAPNTSDGGTEGIDLSKTKPNEYVREKLDAGMEPLIVFVTPILSDEFIASINDGFKRDFEALGFSYAVQDAQNELSRMVDLLENAVEMKASAIIILAVTEGLEDACGKAEAQGTDIVVFGATPSYQTAGLVALDQYEQGKQGGYMVSAWIDQRYPDAGEGEISAMITIHVAQEDNLARSNGYRESLEEDPRIKLVYTGTHETLSVDEGFDFAQEAFSLDPNIRVALAFTPSALYGINNYIVANFPDRLDEFGLFCNTQEETLMELIAAGADNNGSCIRGTIAQGGESAHQGALDCTLALLLGGAEYGYVEYDRMYAVTNFGCEYDSKA